MTEQSLIGCESVADECDAAREKGRSGFAGVMQLLITKPGKENGVPRCDSEQLTPDRQKEVVSRRAELAQIRVAQHLRGAEADNLDALVEVCDAAQNGERKWNDGLMQFVPGFAAGPAQSQVLKAGREESVVDKFDAAALESQAGHLLMSIGTPNTLDDASSRSLSSPDLSIKDGDIVGVEETVGRRSGAHDANAAPVDAHLGVADLEPHLAAADAFLMRVGAESFVTGRESAKFVADEDPVLASAGIPAWLMGVTQGEAAVPGDNALAKILTAHSQWPESTTIDGGGETLGVVGQVIRSDPRLGVETPTEPGVHDEPTLSLGFQQAISNQATGVENVGAGHEPVRVPVLGHTLAEKVISQVVRAASIRVFGNSGEVVLRLDPPHLGAVRMNVAFVDGKMTASIEVGSMAARGALESNVSTLQQNLNAAGVRVDAINVSLDANLARSWGGHTSHNYEQTSFRPRESQVAMRGPTAVEDSQPLTVRADFSRHRFNYLA